MHQQQQEITNSGYIALMSVLIVGTVGASVVVFMLLGGIFGSKTAIVSEQGAQAAVFADTCAEEALQQIRDDATYVGTSSLVFAEGACNYAVSSGGGENRSITASGISGTSTRNVAITVDQINPDINIVSWQEVP